VYVGKTKEDKKKHVHSKQQKIWNYLSQHECEMCGERDPLVLEFDHLHNKRVDISKLIRSTTCSWNHLQLELDKCRVLCSNCHKRKTHQESNSYRYRFLLLAQAG